MKALRNPDGVIKLLMRGELDEQCRLDSNQLHLSLWWLLRDWVYFRKGSSLKRHHVHTPPCSQRSEQPLVWTQTPCSNLSSTVDPAQTQPQLGGFPPLLPNNVPTVTNRRWEARPFLACTRVFCFVQSFMLMRLIFSGLVESLCKMRL